MNNYDQLTPIVQRKLKLMHQALADGPQSMFTDQLVSLWKLAWGFVGDDMRRSFGDHFEEQGRKECRLCVECGTAVAEPGDAFCPKCENDLEELYKNTTGDE